MSQMPLMFHAYLLALSLCAHWPDLYCTGPVFLCLKVFSAMEALRQGRKAVELMSSFSWGQSSVDDHLDLVCRFPSSLCL